MSMPTLHRPLPGVAPALSRQEFARFSELAYRHAGIRLTEAKIPLVQNRLQRRLLATGCGSYHAYHEAVLAPGSSELQACIEALTTNETFFFRHRHHWDRLIGGIIAEWPPKRRLRIWSAAASTGEEAYSAAIACREHLPPGAAAAIEASDINHRVLEAAKRGVYGEYALQKLTGYARERWFLRVDAEHWRVKEEIRQAVDFRPHNLLERHPGGQVDVVFLRNVLIYFDEATKQRVIGHVLHRLSPRGWLFLGGSEALPPHAERLVPAGPQIYRKAA